MLREYEELAVLEQGDDGAVVSIRGQGAPSVLLGANYLVHLQRVVGAAEASSESPALRLLVAEMKLLLQTYADTCHKYCGGTPAVASLAQAREELAALREAINALG